MQPTTPKIIWDEYDDEDYNPIWDEELVKENEEVFEDAEDNPFWVTEMKEEEQDEKTHEEVVTPDSETSAGDLSSLTVPCTKRVELLQVPYKERIEKSRDSKWSIQPGDLVWVHVHKARLFNKRKSKLQPRDDGPFEVLAKVLVLEDSPSSTPSQKPKSIKTLARATVVMLPKSLPSQVPTSIVVQKVEQTQGPDSKPPMLIQGQKEEEVLPMAISDHLLNCVEDTPREEPVLEEIEPITYPQDSNVQESEEESIDEEIPSTKEPITSIDNHALSEDLDQTFFDSLLDGCDFVCPKDSWSEKSWDELLVSDDEDSAMGESKIIVIERQMDSQPIEDKEEINFAIKANDVDLLRRLPPPPTYLKFPPYILLSPSRRDESRILDLDQARIQTRWHQKRVKRAKLYDSRIGKSWKKWLRRQATDVKEALNGRQPVIH
ncbi:unnamed protein product [Cuscuta campestris]|uniref:Tf2-1-like SH3-like domain-containing protein n=1 Tax=Cuscuta campestris TaxID=132261 RepID=A0A484N6S7_9ASTE|nr:unnamed protein product [Cuscuta campestris]